MAQNLETHQTLNVEIIMHKLENLGDLHNFVKLGPVYACQ